MAILALKCEKNPSEKIEEILTIGLDTKNILTCIMKIKSEKNMGYEREYVIKKSNCIIILIMQLTLMLLTTGCGNCMKQAHTCTLLYFHPGSNNPVYKLTFTGKDSLFVEIGSISLETLKKIEDNKKNDIQLETVCLKYVVRISDEDNQTLHDYCSQAIESGVRNEDIHSVTPIGCAHLSIDNKMPNLLFYPPMHPQPVDSLTKKMVSLSGIDMKYWYK